MMEQKKNRAVMYAIVVFVVLLVIDQLTKAIVVGKDIHTTLIPNVLELQTVENRGGAFGVGVGNTGMFIITNLIVLGLIIRFIYLQKDFMDKITLYTLFVILAGGFGNLIDRLTRGFVVDFIRIFPTTNFPNFNLADMYITIGWVVLAFMFAMYSYKEIRNSKKTKE